MNFKEGIADIYDLMYKDKDYVTECNFIDRILREYADGRIIEVLDAGCGSGNHAAELSRKGYNILGFDLSEVMIKKAGQKYRKTPNMEFHTADIRRFNFNKKFDACICMFVVMGYMTKDTDIQAALKNIRKHLKKGALFVFDIWNGLAVLRLLPSVRIKTVEDKTQKVIRIAEPHLDAFNHICNVNYRFIILEKNKLVKEVNETHSVRFYFPQEIKHYLSDAGFEVLNIFPFLDLNGKVDENVWNLGIVARAV